MKAPGWLSYAVFYARFWWADWRSRRHDPFPGCVPPARQLQDECAIHGHEPIPPDCFRVCGECWHAYPTAQALVDEHNRVLHEMAVTMQPDRLPAPELTQAEWEAMLREPRPPHGLPVEISPEDAQRFRDDLERAMIEPSPANPQVSKIVHMPPGISMRKVKITKLDEDGKPIGEPVHMPDMLAIVRPAVEDFSLEVPAVSAEMVSLIFGEPEPWEPVEYKPLTVDEVDLITCCPYCTHDW